MANNNENKSITQVFGEKSKDADELMAETLEELKWADRGETADILYKVLTESGDPRYIHKYLNMLPTQANREWMGNMTRMDIEGDPTFADTLSIQEGEKRLAPHKSGISKILKALGIYQEGGEVEGKLSIQAIEDMLLNPRRQNIPSVIKEGDVTGRDMGQLRRLLNNIKTRDYMLKYFLHGSMKDIPDYDPNVLDIVAKTDRINRMKDFARRRLSDYVADSPYLDEGSEFYVPKPKRKRN